MLNKNNVNKDSKEKEDIVIIVFNDKGEIFLQKKAKQEKKYPLHWDYLFNKETLTEEELKNLELIKKIFVDNNTRKQVTVYKKISNKPVSDNGKFFSIKELKEMLKKEEKFTPRLIHALLQFDLTN